jgi:two-component system sensor histidine kinase TctE
MKKSIRRQLLLWLLIPLLSLAIASTIVANWLGISLARNIYDKQLINSVDSVAARVKIRGDKVTVDLPPAAQAVLRHNYHDEFYFQVLSPDGKKISGDPDLPAPPEGITANSEPIFRTINLKGRELRVVSLPVPTPELDVDHVLIQAAETRNTRNELAEQITMSILLAQLLLIICGSIAIWIGVGRGLLLLTKVEKAVEARAPGDLSPLSVEEPVEIISLINALNRLLKQLHDDVEMQKRFISNAAHQLRTPLAALGTYCALARKLAAEKELQGVLADLETGINRMSKIVNRLLALARSEPSVAGTRSSAVFDLNSCASVITAAHVPEALKRRIELEFLSANEPALVHGDQSAVEELTSNLVENAVLHGRAGGTVIVKVTNANGRSTLIVEDEGPGIPPEERGRVFERFYRMSGTEQPGTGLGLAIVREIAASHGATVEISDGRGGNGTSIEVFFPPIAAENKDSSAGSLANSKRQEEYRWTLLGRKESRSN